jgi:hypothetical protein
MHIQKSGNLVTSLAHGCAASLPCMHERYPACIGVIVAPTAAFLSQCDRRSAHG